MKPDSMCCWFYKCYLLSAPQIKFCLHAITLAWRPNSQGYIFLRPGQINAKLSAWLDKSRGWVRKYVYVRKKKYCSGIWSYQNEYGTTSAAVEKTSMVCLSVESPASQWLSLVCHVLTSLYLSLWRCWHSPCSWYLGTTNPATPSSPWKAPSTPHPTLSLSLPRPQASWEPPISTQCPIRLLTRTDTLAMKIFCFS